MKKACQAMTESADLLIALFMVPIILFLGLGNLRVWVPALDREWQDHADRRAVWFLQNDPARDFHPVQVTGKKDILLGLIYLGHLPYPLLYLFALLFSGGLVPAISFARYFVLSNCFYLAGQCLFPLRPPWHFWPVPATDNSVPDVSQNMPEAGLARFDARVGCRISAGLYKQSHWAHGAMPSGHVLWSSLVAIHAFSHCSIFAAVLAGLHVLLTTEGAVYFCHHYLADCAASLVLAGLVAQLVI